MRFLLALGVTALGLGLLYVGLWTWGAGRQFVDYPNAYFELEKPWIALPWDQFQPVDQNGEAKILAGAPSLKPEHSKKTNACQNRILWADVFRDGNGVLRAANLNDSRLAYGERLQILNASEATSLSSGAPRFPELSKLMEQHSECRWWLQLHHNVSDVDLAVSAAIPESMDQRVLFQTDVNAIFTSVKRLRPRWAYGSSKGDRLRWNVYGSFGLWQSVPFAGDVYTTPLVSSPMRPSNRRSKSRLRNESTSDGNSQASDTLTLISTPMIEELRRQKKRIVIGPLSSEEQIQTALALQPDGILLTDHSLLQSRVFSNHHEGK